MIFGLMSGTVDIPVFQLSVFSFASLNVDRDCPNGLFSLVSTVTKIV